MLEKINVQDIVGLAKKAGEAIMEIYQKDFEVEFKADESPLTEADKKANEMIVTGLEALGLGIPVLSEEGKNIPYDERKDWEYFWLVDPVDGTKEFVKKNGEFTVNIALIHKEVPVLGVVYAPALNETYWAKKGEGAFKEQMIADKMQTFALPKQQNRKEGELVVVASKSHMSPETKTFIDEYAVDYPLLTTHSIGSSLKICLVAEGEADIYPRLGPTMEWDTGAAHAVVIEAGKTFQGYSIEDGYFPHLYNKENLLNAWFVVQ
ncbi:3'(2'),5'-bisphosphate nucleotidase CysQ [Thiomicrorhabdus immobilis]|uniref:3'(2'),5'-bisphosphate nucleotidase CysQ n=1 Tax=Thiomicrorhabdus immobilis TaxID=2791037 RepID=A0ABM7MBN4_9GAMM|nr:3'(2'),5'-bisphosphate nucleotidase CysQ [Thiomicrorhabdus immobilis]BCN92762.1 3'(2'),5'-bisphosphate nucleotidase CysQ [Thiomicrorhabdus immobilis]